ncbi:AMP-binding protein [Desertimonas flava]|uniref:AMP-binding protein n=1 Tax=Desertimonas flava TaxID=2064846 RepID=UPI000E3497CC|nr:AMP-binding protein [Desertimonas flava]
MNRPPTTQSVPTAGTFLPAAASRPDETAIVWSDQSISWSQLDERARRWASRLGRLGIERGDRLAVMAKNRPEWVIALVGNLLAGVRHVPMNWHLTVSEVAYILRDSGARVLVVDSDHESVGRDAARHAAVEHVVVVDETADWLDDVPVEWRPTDLAGALLLYTSGTTGHPKGVLRSDQPPSLDEIMPSYRRLADAWRMTEGGTHLVVCPLYHGTPQVMTLMCLALGQSLVLMPSFDAETVLAAIERHRVTATHLVPTQLLRLLRLPDGVRQRYDLSSLVGLWHGAAPCPAWVKQAMIEWLGPVVIEYFGSSEGTGPLIADSNEWLSHPGTVGRPPPFLAVEAVDDEGTTLPTGAVGTLYFRRPEGPPTYVGAPEKTAASRLSDGRFTVGDVGWLDSDGFVYLADRKIDVIISGGVNIYPSEIEAVISEHPGVADCVVFGIPDDEWGEQVKAVVELHRSSETTERDLLDWCRERLAGFKCPRTIDLHDALPRDATGKLKRRLFRDQYWETTGRRI